jgi:hypothetical protein
MIYKIISQTEEGTVFGRIDDDGLCRVTCVAENPEFQEYLKNGGELQDADGNVMSAEEAKAYVATLP